MRDPATDRYDRTFELSQLIDGDLPDDHAAALRAALSEDPGLRKEHDDLARVDQLVRAAAPPLPGVDFARLRSQVSRSIRTTSHPGHRLVRLFVPVAAAAAIALLTLVTPPSPSGPTYVAPPVEVAWGRLATSGGAMPASDDPWTDTVDGVDVSWGTPRLGASTTKPFRANASTATLLVITIGGPAEPGFAEREPKSAGTF